MSNHIESIVIVGGGTAGWLAANYLNRALNRTQPNCKITLIESSDIGTIGVGEATLSTIRQTFSFLGFDETEWMVECNATFKLAIKFVNWLHGNDYYWFPFRTAQDLQRDMINGLPLATYWLKFKELGHEEPLSYFLSHGVSLCNARKSPKNSSHAPYEGAVNYGYHLDAGLLASYLKKEGKKRGIHQIVDNVIEISLNEQGFISHLTTEKTGTLQADLYIDCSGFKGLLINQTLQEPFVSFSDVLLCDHAIAINIPNDSNTTEINPYVTATALNAGWTWHIPLFNRTGNGYVYSSQFISPGEAEAEFRHQLGHKSDNIQAQHIKMRIGRNQRTCVKNCVSLGLASGFIEPLESTGIFFIEAGLRHLVQYFPDKQFSPINCQTYNDLMKDYYEQIRDFIIMHYCTTQRNDTPFWRANQHDLTLPDSLKTKLDHYRLYPPQIGDKLDFGVLNATSPHTYITAVLAGMNWLPTNTPPILEYMDDSIIDPLFTLIQNECDQLCQNSPSHYEYLKYTHFYHTLKNILLQNKD